METSLPTPFSARVYVNLPEGNKLMVVGHLSQVLQPRARIRSAYWNGVRSADEDDNVDQAAAVFEPSEEWVDGLASDYLTVGLSCITSVTCRAGVFSSGVGRMTSFTIYTGLIGFV